MSATNWAYCPKCKEIEKRNHERVVEEWKSSCGKISPEDYDANRPSDKPIEIAETLREDYELWITDDLQFKMHYRASCENCGFEFSKREEIPTGEKVG